MKCPKCGYHSFDYLDRCKKCGGDLREHRGRFGLRGFIFAGRERPAMEGNLPAASLPASGTDASAHPFAESAQPSLATEENRSFGCDPRSAEDSDAEEILALDLSWGDETPPVAQQPGEHSAPAAEVPPGDSCSVSGLLPVRGPELDLAGRFLDSLPHGPEDSESGLSTSAATVSRPADWPFAADDLPDDGLPVAGAASGWAERAAVFPLPGASPARRFAAGGIDLLILGLACVSFVVAGEILFIPAAEDGWLLNPPALLDLAIPYFLVFFAVTFGYFMLFHFLTGQTPGKMFLRLRVEAVDGAPLLFSQAFLRSVGGLLSLLAAGVGFLCIFFDPEGRGWNDRLAGSRVVPARWSEEMEDTAMPEPDAVEEGGSFFS